MVSAQQNNRGFLHFLGNPLGNLSGGNQTSVYYTCTPGKKRNIGLKPVTKKMVSLLRYGIGWCVLRCPDLRCDMLRHGVAFLQSLQKSADLKEISPPQQETPEQGKVQAPSRAKVRALTLQGFPIPKPGGLFQQTSALARTETSLF